MTKLRTVLCTLGLVLALGAAGVSAHASPIVELLFTSLNGIPIAPAASVAAQPGDRLGASLLVRAAAAGVSSYSISLRFDTDLGDVHYQPFSTIISQQHSTLFNWRNQCLPEILPGPQ